MIDYTEPTASFAFHHREAELMLHAATGGDIEDLSEEDQEDLDILLTCFKEWVLDHPYG